MLTLYVLLLRFGYLESGIAEQSEETSLELFLKNLIICYNTCLTYYQMFFTDVIEFPTKSLPPFRLR